jgi:hypothetical protein
MPYDPTSNGVPRNVSISIGTGTQNTWTTLQLNGDRSYSCSSTGDPHISRIDGAAYHYQTPHSYWIVQTPRLSVQCQAKECWGQGGASCNRLCVAHYTDGDKKAAFAFYAERIPNGMAIRTSILKDEGILKNVRRRQTNPSANSMFLEFPDGSLLSANGYLDSSSPQNFEFLNVHATIPAIYQRLSGGFCGSTTSTSTNRQNILPLTGENTDPTNWQYAWTLNPDDTVYNLVYKALNARDNLTSYQLVDKNTMFSRQFKSAEMTKYLNDMNGDGDVIMTTCTNGNRDGVFGLIDTPFPFNASYSLPVFRGFFRLHHVLNGTLFYPGSTSGSVGILKKRDAETVEEDVVSTDTQMEITVNRTSPLYTFVKHLLSSDLSPCVKLVDGKTLENDADSCYLDAKQILKSQEVSSKANEVFGMYINSIAKRCEVLADQVLKLVPQEVQDALVLAIANNQTMTGLQGLAPEQIAAIEAQSLLGSGYFSGSLQCLNGGTLDVSGTSCICQSGFIGTTCSNEVAVTYQAISQQGSKSSASALTMSMIAFIAAFFLVFF